MDFGSSSEVVALLLLFCGVIGVAATLVYFLRNHLRRVRRAARQVDPLAPLTGSRRRLNPFPAPSRWLAIKSMNTEYLRDILGVGDAPASWSDALSRFRERRLFVSPPVDGWTLVIGGGIPDPALDIDASFRFLVNLSKATGEVQFYHMDRVLNFHGWGLLRDGKVVRAYDWAGETLWNEGRMTLDERLLGMKCRDYADSPEALRYGEIPSELQNTERVPLLARRWSLDFIVSSEILLQQEGVESGDEQEPGATGA
ncbi:MAG TPA: hypothetical protein VMF06_03840 [Candidatus Limnocylindria bacterium]|nr:hypothetical protein [Candidatus Limnocylindria bacterium]